MARAPAPVPEPIPEARIAEIAAEIALDPPFVPRLVNARDHGAYLEHTHESTLRALAVIHMRLSRGDTEGALDLLTKLRAHLDRLWDERAQAAAREVAP